MASHFRARLFRYVLQGTFIGDTSRSHAGHSSVDGCGTSFGDDDMSASPTDRYMLGDDDGGHSNARRPLKS